MGCQDDETPSDLFSLSKPDHNTTIDRNFTSTSTPPLKADIPRLETADNSEAHSSVVINIDSSLPICEAEVAETEVISELLIEYKLIYY